jgi:hypothetical protein
VSLIRDAFGPMPMWRTIEARIKLLCLVMLVCYVLILVEVIYARMF